MRGAPLLLALSCLAPSAHGGFLQAPGELARAEASVAQPFPEYAVFYNPAAFRQPGFMAFTAVRSNHGGYAAYRLISEFETKSDQEKFAQLTGLLNRQLQMGLATGATYSEGDSSVGLVVDSGFRGSAHSEVVPRLDADLFTRSSFYLSTRRHYWGRRLKVGASLKPTHKIEHRARESALSVIDKKGAFSPAKYGREGLGLGLDASLALQDTVLAGRGTLAVTGLDLGGLAFRPLRQVNPKSPGSPWLDRPQAIVSGAWRYKPRASSLPGIELMAAYWRQDDPLATQSPLRLAASLSFGSVFTYSLGYRSQAISQGLRVAGKFASFHLGTHTEAVGEYGFRIFNTQLVASLHAQTF